MFLEIRFSFCEFCLFCWKENYWEADQPLTAMDRYCSAGNYQKLSSYWKLFLKVGNYQNSVFLVRFLCFVKKKRQITGIVLNSIYGIRFMELFISWFDWKLLGYWKCDHCDFLLEWVIGCILLSLLPDGLNSVKRVFLAKCKYSKSFHLIHRNCEFLWLDTNKLNYSDDDW